MAKQSSRGRSTYTFVRLNQRASALLAAAKHKYPRLSQNMLASVALEWYLQQLDEHGMDPITWFPLQPTKKSTRNH